MLDHPPKIFVFGYLRVETARDILIQATLLAPMFGIRWRWNVTRALAVLRQRAGRKVPPQLQRLALAGEHFKVPGSERASFTLRYYPRLARMARRSRK